MLVWARMVKGRWARSLDEAQGMPARDVLQALNYEGFLADYESAYMEMNRDSR